MSTAGFTCFAQGNIHWLDQLLISLSSQLPPGYFFSNHYNLRALIGLILVSLICGAVSSLVVGGRMAFFSDAIAHCAFAGVSIGFLLFTVLLASQRPASEFWNWVMPVMVVFGILVGLGIAYVRSQTGLASDTVIGVFFAGAIGLAAMLRKQISSRELFNLEDFLFGDPLNVRASDLVVLFGLAVFTGLMLAAIYNSLLLTSFNDALARSRRIRVRLCSYLFIILLALIVNLCLLWVGVLLVNALLVVPGATAANVSRNLRQMFWFTILLALVVSVGGQVLSYEIYAWTENWRGTDRGIELGIPGTVIMLSVLFFVLSMIIARVRAMRQPSAPAEEPA